MASLLKAQKNHGLTPTIQVDRLLELFSRNAELLGRSIRPYHPERRSSGLCAQPQERLNAVIRNLSVCVEATEFALIQSAKGAPVGHLFLWRALKNFGFTPSGDLFNQLDENSCIEVYDDRGIWVFGNLHFFGATSYTLADLYEFPWHSLWHRGELDQARTYALGTKILSNQVQGILTNPLPTHTVRERSNVPGIESEFGLEVELQPLLVTPLHRRGSPDTAGFLHSFRTNWVRSTREYLPEQQKAGAPPFRSAPFSPPVRALPRR